MQRPNVRPGTIIKIKTPAGRKQITVGGRGFTGEQFRRYVLAQLFEHGKGTVEVIPPAAQKQKKK